MSFEIKLSKSSFTDFNEEPPQDKEGCDVEIYLETSKSSYYLFSEYFSKEDAQNIRERSRLIQNVAEEFVRHYMNNHFELDDFNEFEYKDETAFWEDIKSLSIKLREELYKFFKVN